MSPDFYKKWSHILADIDTHTIPIEFIKKLVVKLKGRRQHTINIERMLHKFKRIPEALKPGACK